MGALGQALVIGRDGVPVETTAQILTHFWNVRMLIADPAVPPSIKFDHGDDVVVICDSFTEEERQVWVDYIRLTSPTLLVVKMNGFDAGPHAGADATVDYTHGPAALVATIYELLTERGIGHRGWAEEPTIGYVQ